MPNPLSLEGKRKLKWWIVWSIRICLLFITLIFNSRYLRNRMLTDLYQYSESWDEGAQLSFIAIVILLIVHIYILIRKLQGNQRY